MSQVPVKLANTCELWVDTPNGPVYESSQVDNRMIPVVPLSALREWLTGFSCVCAHSNIHSSQEWDRRHENWCPQLKAQRLLASLGEKE